MSEFKTKIVNVWYKNTGVKPELKSNQSLTKIKFRSAAIYSYKNNPDLLYWSICGYSYDIVAYQIEEKA